MTPEEADTFLTNHDKITVVERDLSPDETEMGRAQFLITLVGGIDVEAEVQAEIEEKELEYFKESSPSQFRHVALPPEE